MLLGLICTVCVLCCGLLVAAWLNLLQVWGPDLLWGEAYHPLGDHRNA